MGAGEYESGDGAAGEDPVEDPSTPRNVTMPRAAKWDAATRTFTYDSDGRLEDVDPIEQEVALSLSVVAESMASVPELGHYLRSVRSASLPDIQRKCYDLVRLALKRRIDSGDVEILSVAASSPTRGALVVEVDTQRLRVAGAEKQTTTVRFNGA